jgi:hypothetical protein
LRWVRARRLEEMRLKDERRIAEQLWRKVGDFSFEGTTTIFCPLFLSSSLVIRNFTLN